LAVINYTQPTYQFNRLTVPPIDQNYILVAGPSPYIFSLGLPYTTRQSTCVIDRNQFQRKMRACVLSRVVRCIKC